MNINDKKNELNLEEISLLKKLWLSITIGLLLFIVVAGLWWAMEKREDTSRFNMVESEASIVLDIISVDLRTRIQSLQRIVKRWEVRGGTPKEEFDSDAMMYINDDPGYLALEWVDKTFHVRWIVPLEGNEAALNLDLSFEKNRRLAMETARDQKSPILSAPVNLVQGGKGFLVYLPIFIEEEFEGYVIAVFRIKPWLDYLIHTKESPEEIESFLAKIYIDGEKVYVANKWENQQNPYWNASVKKNLYGHDFEIYIKSTNLFVKRSHTMLPEIVFSAGIFLTFLISIIVFLIQKTKRSLKITLKAKIDLEKEIVVRESIDLLLKEERQRLAYILEGTNVGTWEWYVQTGETIFNERWADRLIYHG